MKHAGTQALDALDDLLEEIRSFEGLKEKRRGAFYRKSSGFLHFHEDPAGFFADLKIDDEYQRFRVNTASERKALVRRIAALMRAS
jgi:hypothetical protein